MIDDNLCFACKFRKPNYYFKFNQKNLNEKVFSQLEHGVTRILPHPKRHVHGFEANARCHDGSHIGEALHQPFGYKIILGLINDVDETRISSLAVIQGFGVIQALLGIREMVTMIIVGNFVEATMGHSVWETSNSRCFPFSSTTFVVHEPARK